MATTTDSGLAAHVAAIASLGAAVIHLAVMPTHWREWVPSGLFFAGIAVFQLAWGLGVLARRPRAAVLAAGILVNLGSVALWAVSRTTGTPFGPHAGEPELVQAAGICSVMLQCYVVMGSAWLWSRGRRAGAVPVIGYGLILTGATGVIAAAVTVGVASGLQHDHQSPVGAAHDGHAPAAGEYAGHQRLPGPYAPAPLGGTSGRTAPRIVVVEPAAPAGSHDHG